MWDTYFADRSDSNKLAIYRHYLEKRFVHRIAGAILRKTPQSPLITEDDLLAAGEFALWQSIDRFEAGKGAQFATFAGTRVRGAMLDWIRSNDWVGRRGRKAEKEGESVPEMCSIDQLIGFEQSGSESQNPLASIEIRRAAVRHLDHLQRKVFGLLFVDGLKSDQVARRLGTTAAKVEQLQEEILGRVRLSGMSG